MRIHSNSKGARRARSVDEVLVALETHALRAALVRAGKQADDLLRALIPLFLAPKSKEAITGGTISIFWKLHGVKIEGPRAARALREHIGYARCTRHGRRITPNGIAYVRHAIDPRLARG